MDPSGALVMIARREIPLCHYRYDPLDQLISCATSAQANTQRFYLKDRLANEVHGGAAFDYAAWGSTAGGTTL